MRSIKVNLKPMRAISIILIMQLLIIAIFNPGVITLLSSGDDSNDVKTIFELHFNGTVAGYNLIAETYDEKFLIITSMPIKDYFETSQVTIIKIDRKGNQIWNRAMGGPLDAHIDSIQKTADNGFILSGTSVSNETGEREIWLVKLDRDGIEMWDIKFGSLNDLFGVECYQTSDGGYIIAGNSYSDKFNDFDGFLMKIDDLGNPIWQNTYGGIEDDEFNGMCQTSDNAFILTGYTDSFSDGRSELWVLKIHDNGTTIWDKTYNPGDDDYGTSVIELSNGNYLVIGYTYPGDGFSKRPFLMEINKNGKKLWTGTYGSESYISRRSVQQSPDGNYIFLYSSRFYRGGDSWWIMKNDEGTDPIAYKRFGHHFYHNYHSLLLTSDDKYIVIGDKITSGPNTQTTLVVLEIEELDSDLSFLSGLKSYIFLYLTPFIAFIFIYFYTYRHRKQPMDS